MEDHPSLPRSLPTRVAAASSSSSRSQSTDNKSYPYHRLAMERFQAAFGTSNTTASIQSQPLIDIEADNASLSSTGNNGADVDNVYRPLLPSASMDDHNQSQGMFFKQALGGTGSGFIPTVGSLTSDVLSTSNNFNINVNSFDELHKLVSFQQQQTESVNSLNHIQQLQYFSGLPAAAPQSLPLCLNTLPMASLSDRLWEWNPIPEADRQYNDPFK